MTDPNDRAQNARATNGANGSQQHHHQQLKEGVTKLPKEVRNVMAGGCAGMVAKTVVAPLERIKILYQVSAEKFALRDVPKVAQTIIQKEGFTALWRGNTATMLRVFPYSGIQFMVFDRCKTTILKQHRLRRRNSDEVMKSFGLTPVESLVAGMIAGAVSVCSTYPLDLTRAQLALYRTHRHSKNMGFIGVIRHNFSLGVGTGNDGLGTRICQSNLSDCFLLFTIAGQGVRGLFRGLTPTVLGILPYSGIAFALNEQGKRKVRKCRKQPLLDINSPWPHEVDHRSK